MRKNLACFKHFVLSLLFLMLFSGVLYALPYKSIHLSWQDQNVSDTTMTITWLESFENSHISPKKQAYVKYGNQTGVYNISVESTSQFSTNLSKPNTTYVHTAELYGLSPDSTYYFIVGDDNNWSEENSFTTGPKVKSDKNFRFVVGSDIHAGSSDSRRTRLSYWINQINNPKPGFFSLEEMKSKAIIIVLLTHLIK